MQLPMSNTCEFHLLENGYLHCPNCNQPDWKNIHGSDQAKWPQRNCQNIPSNPAITRNGPGDHLHRLIARFTGQKENADCACKSRIAEMNANGVEWCEANIPTIVGWLMEEAEKRGLLKSKIKKWAAPKVAKLLIKWAIRKAKK
jgi:hypothetical protein